MTVITKELKSKAEVYYGDEICREKSQLLLSELALPTGLLPLKDIQEVGRLEETGFVWLKQKKKIEHLFEKIGKSVSYSSEITAYVEKGKIKKLTGVKAKEILIWVPIYEIADDDPPTGKLTFRSTAGLFKTFPTSAFELAEEVKATQAKNEAIKEVSEEKNDEKKDVNEDKDEKKENGGDVAIVMTSKERIFVPAVMAPAAQAVENK